MAKGRNDLPGERTWYVVADSAQARILYMKRRGRRRRARLLKELAQPVPPTRDIVTDRRGSGRLRGGGRGYAMDSRSDPHEEQKRAFVRELARLVSRAVLDHRCDELIVIAAPRTLGELRGQLEGYARNRVVREIPKDLTCLSRAELEARLLQPTGLV